MEITQNQDDHALLPLKRGGRGRVGSRAAPGAAREREGQMNRQIPTIVCLCGSTRFSEAFREANLQETLAGKIVLSIGCEWHGDQALGLTEDDKKRLDELHLRKIDLADEVYILNVGGYVGESTMREILYAARYRKALHWLQVPTNELMEKILAARFEGLNGERISQQ